LKWNYEATILKWLQSLFIFWTSRILLWVAIVSNI